jgi:ribosomal protein L10
VLAPRLIREFSEKFKKIQLKGGIVNSEVKELDYIQALSHVESREKLYGKLLFLMLYPLTTFAQVAQLAADKGAEAGVETVADIPAGEAAAEEDAPAEDAPEEAAPAEETNEDAPAEDA